MNAMRVMPSGMVVSSCAWFARPAQVPPSGPTMMKPSAVGVALPPSAAMQVLLNVQAPNASALVLVGMKRARIAAGMTISQRLDVFNFWRYKVVDVLIVAVANSCISFSRFV